MNSGCPSISSRGHVPSWSAPQRPAPQIHGPSSISITSVRGSCIGIHIASIAGSCCSIYIATITSSCCAICKSSVTSRMIQKAPCWSCYRGVKCLLRCPPQGILLFHIYLPDANQEQEEKQCWTTPHYSIALWLVHREVGPIDGNVAIPKTQDHQLLPVRCDNRLPSWCGGQHATRTRKHRFDVLDGCGKQRPWCTDPPIILR